MGGQLAPDDNGTGAPILRLGALPYPAGSGALLPAGVPMAHPFETLTPDLVLDAVESIGFLSDARVLALNSYENRVYQVGIEDGEPLIAKFYRPQRWTNDAILEEHRFTFELADCEVPGSCAIDPQRREPVRTRRFPLHLVPSPWRPCARARQP